MSELIAESRLDTSDLPTLPQRQFEVSVEGFNQLIVTAPCQWIQPVPVPETRAISESAIEAEIKRFDLAIQAQANVVAETIARHSEVFEKGPKRTIGEIINLIRNHDSGVENLVRDVFSEANEHIEFFRNCQVYSMLNLIVSVSGNSTALSTLSNACKEEDRVYFRLDYEELRNRLEIEFLKILDKQNQMRTALDALFKMVGEGALVVETKELIRSSRRDAASAYYHVIDARIGSMIRAWALKISEAEQIERDGGQPIDTFQIRKNSAGMEDGRALAMKVVGRLMNVETKVPDQPVIVLGDLITLPDLVEHIRAGVLAGVAGRLSREDHLVLSLINQISLANLGTAGFAEAQTAIPDGAIVCLDAKRGLITSGQASEVQTKLKRLDTLGVFELGECFKPTFSDGSEAVKLNANAAYVADVGVGLGSYSGLGLFRTEIALSLVSGAQTELDQQVQIFEQIFEGASFAFAGRRSVGLVIRPGDYTNDKKKLSTGHIPGEALPGFTESELLIHLRALVLAANLENGRCPFSWTLLWPQVTTINDIQAHVTTVEGVISNLGLDKSSINIKHGAQIESPEAVKNLHDILQERRVTEIAIGTNDMLACLQNAPRGGAVPTFKEDLQLVKLLSLCVKEVHDASHNRGEEPIGLQVCGDLASDPKMALVLRGLGISQLSIEPGAGSSLCEIFSKVTEVDCQKLAANLVAKFDEMAIAPYAKLSGDQHSTMRAVFSEILDEFCQDKGIYI